ncbi:MAG: hypothetical protein L0Z62_40050 [Gemmataceae bacterium]|nr:hypothetical protein [Gemmataceae bacterium]
MWKPFSPFPSLVLATFLAVGFAAIWGVLVKFGHETVRSFRPVRLEERPLFLADGTPVVERVCLVRGQSIVPPQEQFRDLEGNLVQVPGDARWATGVALYRRRRGEELLGSLLSLDESWDWRVRRLSSPHEPVAWYFLCDGRRHGLAHFVAYDTREARRVGYLGTAGFRADPLPPEEYFPFNGSDRGIMFRLLNHGSYGRFLPVSRNISHQPRILGPEPIYVHADNDTIYQVDLAARLVRIAFAGRPIEAAGLLTRYVPAPDAGRTFLVVRTDDAVLEFDGQNQLVRQFPIPEDLREWFFAWIETPSGIIVTLRDREYDLQMDKVLFQISWFDAAGRLLRREETWIRVPPLMDERVLAAATLSPAVGYWIVSDPLMIRSFDRWSAYLKVLRNRLAEFWPALVLAHVVAAGLAGLSYRRLRRYGASWTERVVWPVFVFALGLPGWVGFRCARSWPVLEPCPACGAVVPRDRVPCARCAADFPLPARKGTEVFA